MSKHVQEMLWVDSDFSDWESDDDELTDVRATGIMSKSTSARHPALMLMMMRAWTPKISQSTRSPSWNGYLRISLLKNVRR